MITLIPFNSAIGEPPPFYKARCVKQIGTFKPSDFAHTLQMMKCTGRIYQPGKSLDGKFIDTEGAPDKRLMIMSTSWENHGYACASKEQIDECFKEIVFESVASETDG